MNSSYDDGVATLRRWQNEDARLWVQFWEPSQTSVSGKCFISELTDESLKLQFGAIALGTLTLSLPIKGVFVAPDTAFTYLRVADAPAQIRANLEPFVELLELRYRFWGDGCRLLRYKDVS
jgi:hypothetical protein